MRCWVALTITFVTALGFGCSDFSFEGFLSQPIEIDMPSAVPVIEIGFAEREATIAAVDSGSPLTIVFGNGDGSRARGDLRLRENIPLDRQGVVGKPVVTRFVLHDVEAYDLPLAPVGLAPAGVALGGIVGADVLSHVSVSLVYETVASSGSGRGSLTLRDEISGTSDELSGDCDLCNLLKQGGLARERCNAVVGVHRRGGGKAVIGGSERVVKATRLVVGVCALPDTFDPTEPSATAITTTGTPMAALISTGLGTSVMAQSAFARLQLQDPGLQVEPGHTLRLPYGEEPASLVRIARMAVVSSETSDLGPCGEIARRRRMLVAKLDTDDEGRAGAAIASAGNEDNTIEVAVIADESALFQGLRQELRPQTADVDLLLGGSFLRFFETALDYPVQRVVLRCTEQTTELDCEVIPHCNEGGTPPCSSARGLSDQPC